MSIVIQFADMFYNVMTPIIVIAAVGYVIQRSMKLDMDTLTKLNFYFIIPAIIYVSILRAASKITFTDVAVVAAMEAAMLAILAVVTLIVFKIRKLPEDQRNALLMTGLFHNSGNYGLPLQEVAFRSVGKSAQASSLQLVVMLMQNVLIFTLGIFLASTGKQKRSLREFARFFVMLPPIWGLAAALVSIGIQRIIGPENTQTIANALGPITDSIQYIANGFYAIAIFTLGAQLGQINKTHNHYPIKMSVILRLLVSPAISLGLIYLFGIKGFTAQVIFISSTTPTSVNCMLICLQYNNHPDYVARSAFYSTVLSPITVSLAVFLAQSGVLKIFDG